LHDALGNFPARLHGIWGAEDVTARGYLPEREQLLQQIDPEASFLVVPHAGHWVQYEAADRVNERLVRIVESLE
jgi:pimeloyl-ACP methyl ester carboxylesterase